jgi:hypothetical protein
MKDPDRVLDVAQTILEERNLGRKITSSEALLRMVGLNEIPDSPPRMVRLQCGISMRITRGKKVKFEFDTLDKTSFDLIERAIVEALSLQASVLKPVNCDDLLELTEVRN